VNDSLLAQILLHLSILFWKQKEQASSLIAALHDVSLRSMFKSVVKDLILSSSDVTILPSVARPPAQQPATAIINSVLQHSETSSDPAVLPAPRDLFPNARRQIRPNRNVYRSNSPGPNVVAESLEMNAFEFKRDGTRIINSSIGRYSKV
jgi:hypothetical protein